MIELQALKNVFGTHDEWHAYKNVRTGKGFCRHKPLKKPGPDIEKVGMANGCCHKDALRAAKKIVHPERYQSLRCKGPAKIVGATVMPNGDTHVSGPKKTFEGSPRSE